MLPPILLLVVAHYSWLAQQKNLPFEITSIYRPPNTIAGESNIHADYRAVDISVRGWSQDDILEVRDEIQATYRKYGAKHPTTLEREVFVWGDPKHLDHVHLQVSPEFK